MIGSLTPVTFSQNYRKLLERPGNIKNKYLIAESDSVTIDQSTGMTKCMKECYEKACELLLELQKK